jgi:CBS domain-containing protein
MKVEELMTHSVRTCRSGDTLSTAAQLMWDGDCGCVPVISDDGSKRVVRMITDRDICMATHFRGCRPREIAVGDVMSTGVRSMGPSEDLADTEAIMARRPGAPPPGRRREPELLGVVSLADLARGGGPQAPVKAASDHRAGGRRHSDGGLCAEGPTAGSFSLSTPVA